MLHLDSCSVRRKESGQTAKINNFSLQKCVLKVKVHATNLCGQPAEMQVLKKSSGWGGGSGDKKPFVLPDPNVQILE